jgi:hypothetical protein
VRLPTTKRSIQLLLRSQFEPPFGSNLVANSVDENSDCRHDRIFSTAPHTTYMPHPSGKDEARFRRWYKSAELTYANTVHGEMRKKTAQ